MMPMTRQWTVLLILIFQASIGCLGQVADPWGVANSDLFTITIIYNGCYGTDTSVITMRSEGGVKMLSQHSVKGYSPDETVLFDEARKRRLMELIGAGHNLPGDIN